MTTFDLTTANKDYNFAVKVAERMHLLREDYEGGSFFRAETEEEAAMFENCLFTESTEILDMMNL